jgi:hypothetical protein
MKRKVVICAIIFLGLCQGPVNTFAQHDLSLYNMQIVPQRSFLNPAFIPDQKFYIGIPVLSGVQSAYANPFSYNDVIERDAYDSVTFKVENFLGQLAKSDRFLVYSNVDILSAGSQVAGGRFFLNFSVRERICQQITFPENLGNLLWYGNASPQFFGKEVNVAPTVNFTAYDEWGASFSGYAMKKKMTWGAKLKYLSGRINATTTRSDFYVYTDTSTYDLHIRSDIEVQTSGIDDIEHYLDKRVTSLVFPGNNGVGVDLGLSYQFNKQIGISASVLDIGFISWKANTLTMVSHNPGEEIDFKGFTLNDFTDMLGNLDTFGRTVSDTVRDMVKIDSVYGNKYTSWLPVKYNIGGSWSFNEHHRLNLLLNGISWHHQFFPALSVSYYYQLPGVLGLTVSYNLFNKQYYNFGAGLSVNAGPVQLYIISDNVPGLIFYKGTNNSSIQFGINIAINRKKEVPAESPLPEPAPSDAVK